VAERGVKHDHVVVVVEGREILLDPAGAPRIDGEFTIDFVSIANAAARRLFGLDDTGHSEQHQYDDEVFHGSHANRQLTLAAGVGAGPCEPLGSRLHSPDARTEAGAFARDAGAPGACTREM